MLFVFSTSGANLRSARVIYNNNMYFFSPLNALYTTLYTYIVCASLKVGHADYALLRNLVNRCCALHGDVFG